MCEPVEELECVYGSIGAHRCAWIRVVAVGVCLAPFVWVCVCAHRSLSTPVCVYRHTCGVPVCLGVCMAMPVSPCWNCMDLWVLEVGLEC